MLKSRLPGRLFLRIELLHLTLASLLALLPPLRLHFLPMLGLSLPHLRLSNGMVIFKINKGVLVGLRSLLEYVLLELVRVEHVFVFLFDLVFGVFVHHPHLVLLLLLDELLLLTTIWVREWYCGGLVVCCSFFIYIKVFQNRLIKRISRRLETIGL